MINRRHISNTKLRNNPETICRFHDYLIFFNWCIFDYYSAVYEHRGAQRGQAPLCLSRAVVG